MKKVFVKPNILDQFEICLRLAWDYNRHGDPRRAVIENRKAMKMFKKIKKIITENDAIFEANIFLMGESNITRKSKTKKICQKN